MANINCICSSSEGTTAYHVNIHHKFSHSAYLLREKLRSLTFMNRDIICENFCSLWHAFETCYQMFHGKAVSCHKSTKTAKFSLKTFRVFSMLNVASTSEVNCIMNYSFVVIEA